MRETLRVGAEEIVDYIKRRRRELTELFEAHTRDTYGLIEYNRDGALILVEIAKNTINMLKNLEARIFGENENGKK